MKKTAFVFFKILLCVTLVGQQPDVPPDLSSVQLLSAKELLVLQSTQVYLEAHLSVDFMPTVPSTGGRPQAVIFIKTKNKSPIPTSIKADAIWILSKEKAWKAWLPKTSPTPRYDTPDVIDRVVSGHTFAPGTQVDVIVMVKHFEKPYFLKVTNVAVRATY